MHSDLSTASSGSSSSSLPPRQASECWPSASRSSPDSSLANKSGPHASGPGIAALASDLHAYEKLLQALFAKGGELSTSAILAQVGRNLSPVAGHQVLAAISNAQLLTSSALGQVAEAHRMLEMLGRKLGIDVQAFGDVLKPPASAIGVEPYGADG